MADRAYLLVFDGMADWEPAHALCEIRRSKKYQVITVGFNDAQITTMGGLRVIPDTTLDQFNVDDVAILILPGGDMWEERSNPQLIELLKQLHSNGVIIAAICGATLEIARAGLTKNTRHTSNALAYLVDKVTDYCDQENYIDQLAVADKGVITASGLGSVDFAREIFRQLEIYSEQDCQIWFDMFKHGIYPKE